MAKRVEDFELDPVVVPIVEDFDLTIEDWLVLIRRDEALPMVLSGAELVAEARVDEA